MSKQKNLFELLKPEAKRNLIKNRIKYEFSVNNLIEVLKSTFTISDLTVHQLSSTYNLTETETYDPETFENFHRYDVIYGTKLFNENE